MEDNCLIDEIKKKDLDIEGLAKRAIEDKKSRDQVVYHLIADKNIMIYYHCYYILSYASEINPKLFYKYWDDFVSLLNHNNSYHRDIGMTLIANLVSVDTDGKFDNIFDKYISHINDKKFMTSQCCIKSLKKIAQERKDLIDAIVSVLLQIDDRTSYFKKQKELLKYGVLDIFQIVYNRSNHKNEIKLFIENCIESISPKTRNMAKKLKKESLL